MNFNGYSASLYGGEILKAERERIENIKEQEFLDIYHIRWRETEKELGYSAQQEQETEDMTRIRNNIIGAIVFCLQLITISIIVSIGVTAWN